MAKQSEKKAVRKVAKKLGFYVTAKENAYLADGTFLKKGNSAKVPEEYVVRLREANDTKFVITQE